MSGRIYRLRQRQQYLQRSSEPPKPEAPKTGDWMNVPVWGGMTVLSGMAAVGLLIIKLKKKK